MKKIKKEKKFFLIIILLFVLFNPLSIFSDTIISPQQKFRILSEKLDSLDLVKQNLKRKGVEITDIENEQAKLRDSLEIIRKEINNQLINRRPSSLKRSKKILPFLKTPSDFFDLLILVMTILAIISGILLIREIDHNIKLRKIKKNEKRESQKVTSITVPPPIYPSYDNIPESVREYTNSKLSKEDKIGFINKLKDVQEVVNQEVKESKEEDRNTAELDALQKENISIEEKIIKAARMGIDINNISKFFHISVDQISLILKIAESRYKKRGNT